MCLNTIFSNERGVRLTKANRISGHRPLITAGYENNGVATYISNPEQKIFSKNVITIDMFGNTFFRNYEFSADDNILVLTSLIGDIPNSAQIYIASSINKAIAEKYSYGKQFRQMSFNETLITLPIYDNGKIAFDYMTDYIKELEAERIKELEAERIRELEAYLFATGLNDYVLTDEEKKLIEDFKNGTVHWGTFKIVDVFNVKNTKNILSRDIVKNSGEIPYLTAREANNSIETYISHYLSQIEEGNSIFIGGKTLTVTYQELNYFSNDSHNLALYYKEEDKRTRTNQLFMVASIYKSLSHLYTWGDSISNKKIQKDCIKFPIRYDGIPDFDKMSAYIRAIEKLVIKDVVKWKDNQIAMMTKIVNGHTTELGTQL